MFTQGFLIDVNGGVGEQRVTYRFIEHEPGSLNIEWNQLPHPMKISYTCTGIVNHVGFR